MRISDWSSDVCSSDLSDNPRIERLAQSFFIVPEERRQIAHILDRMAPAETCKIVKVIAQIADLDIQDGSYFGAFGEELATIARDERDARTMLRNIAPEPDCAKFHTRIDNTVIGTHRSEGRRKRQQEGSSTK